MVVLRLGHGFKAPGRIALTRDWQRQLVAIAFTGSVSRNGWSLDDSVAPYATESWGKSGAKTDQSHDAESLALPFFGQVGVSLRSG